MVGKKESEVSKWLTGTHNFTLKTIAKISAVLGEPIVEVTLQPIDDAEFFFSDIANLFDDDEVFYESLHTSGRVSYIPENHIYITSLNKNAVC